ncbi:MAG TPA: type IV pilus secretin PilQ [Gallionellaceae bacterium]
MRQFENAAQYFKKMALIVCAVYSVSANAQNVTAGPSDDALNSIETVTTSKSEGGKILVTIGMKNAASSIPEVFTIGTPPRIALTFAKTTNDLGQKSKEFNEGFLRNAVIVQAPDPLQKFRTRMVLNLSQSMTYDKPVIDGKNIVLVLRPAESVAGTREPTFAENKSGAQTHSLRDIDFHRGKNGEGRVQIELSDSNVGVDIKQEGAKLIVDFAKTELPANLQRKLDVMDFATPVQLIDASARGNNARLVIEPKGAWEYAAYQADTKFIIEVKPISAEVKKQAKVGPKQYEGDKLTLNFQNITVREALNVIADFTNLNIVISDTVSGNLTLRLKDVPWDQALDIILQSKGLDFRRNGNVMQIAPRDELAAKEKGALTAVQEISELEPMHTESFQLSYAKAVDIVKLITDTNQRMLSKRGSAVQDLRTNTLFVQDTSARLDDVRNLIKLIDVPVRQVMIEARFVQAKDTFTRNLGGRMDFKGPTQMNSVIGTPTTNYTSGIGTGNVNLPGASSGTGGLTLALTDASGTNTLNLELLASQTDGVTKNIASPRVITADKSPATIESGTEIPYLQQTSSGATNVAFKKAVLSLTVTPIITPDDHVNMNVAVNQDSVGAVYSGIGPSVDTKKVTTQVLVDNGGTVVIGGVYSQNDSDSVTKVPLLGDIPIIGWLFKNKSVSRDKTELLVFITPKIMKESLNLR